MSNANIKTQDKYGPGIWFMLHTNAVIATTPEQIKNFIEQVKNLGEHFPCHQCKPHFQRYCKEHPIEGYVNKERGMFLWVWEFHESVNKRLGKPSMTFDEAWKHYTSKDSICNDDCGETSTTPSRRTAYTIKTYEQILRGY